MPSLRELQTGFARAVFDAGATREAPGIRGNGLSPASRLGFYRTSVFENYRKALGSTYPAIGAVVGPGCFRQLAHEYTRRCPSRSADVGMHGERFPDFLGRHRVAATLPYLPDLARLEWAIEESFHEAEHPPLALDALMSVEEAHYPELRFSLAPACRLFESAFPVHRIWQMCQTQDAGDGESIGLDTDAVRLLVRREDYVVMLEPLAAADFAMLRALQSGYGLGEAFAYAQSMDRDFDPAAFLQRHVANAVLAGFTLPAELHAPDRPTVLESL
jgi:hypothetical protein